MSFQLLYQLLLSPVQLGSCWYNLSFSMWQAMARKHHRRVARWS